MFKKFKSGRIELLLIFLMTFNMTLHDYLVVQGLLILESNQLLTGHEIRTNKNVEELLSLEALDEINYRLFARVAFYSPYDDIWLFYTNDFSNWMPPLSEGSFFNSAHNKQALVGQNVALTERNDGLVYVFNGEAYEVVGILGLLNPSLLDDMVLLNGSDFWKQHELDLMVDANDSELLATALGSSSVNERSDIGAILETDFFTPMIVIYSWLISSLLILIIAYLYDLDVKDEVKVRFLIGENQFRLFGRMLISLLVKIRSALVILFVGLWLLNPRVNLSVLGLQGFFLLALLILSYTTLFFRKSVTKARWS
ncbi:MAG: hypothetical protein FWG67_00820 [Defluviitaleaceae bacterium]|nr:hypothetical protein [Defluviitaleaceae bacterium]